MASFTILLLKGDMPYLVQQPSVRSSVRLVAAETVGTPYRDISVRLLKPGRTLVFMAVIAELVSLFSQKSPLHRIMRLMAFITIPLGNGQVNV